LASASGTAIAIMALAILIYILLILLRAGGLFWLSIFAGVIGAVIILLGIGTTFLADDSTYSVLGKDATLTGRTTIWAGVWSATNQGYWLLGFGYETFFSSPIGSGSVNWEMGEYIPPHAHNGFLQTWLNIGFVGVCLIAFALVLILVKACLGFASSTTRISTLDIIFITYFMVLNITEQAILVYNNYIWCIFVAVAALPSQSRVGFRGPQDKSMIRDRELPPAATNQEATGSGGGVGS
jgi:O-antigen ligase